MEKSGFTLIELSIVLVIIGLIAGGVLVGRDLIHAAEIRSMMRQEEQYDTAVATFKGKYNALPGDIAADQALQLGFNPRSGNMDEGNNDGIISKDFYMTVESECAWTDLSMAQLISDHLNNTCPGGANITIRQMSDYYPPTRGISMPGSVVLLGYNSTKSDYEIGHYFLFAQTLGGSTSSIPSAIFYSSSVTNMPGLFGGNDAALIDAKFDDGLPRSGRVRYGAALFRPLYLEPLGGILNFCASPSANAYLIYPGDETQTRCNLMVQASF